MRNFSAGYGVESLAAGFELAGQFYTWNPVNLWELFVNERWYRLVQGIYLLVALYLESQTMIFSLIALLSAEALSNIQLPVVLSKLRYGKQAETGVHPIAWSPFKFSSERLLRVVVVLLLVISCIFSPELIWFIPWFVAAMLLLAGITNICPMVMMFRRIGFE